MNYKKITVYTQNGDKYYGNNPKEFCEEPGYISFKSVDENGLKVYAQFYTDKILGYSLVMEYEK